MEIWNTIQEYENLYEVSNKGNVRGLKYNKLLKLRQDNREPYYIVRLCKKSKESVKRVHRLVAIAFIDNPDKLPVVNHKDGNKLNNSVENLEWCSYSDNTKHAIELGLIKFKQGEDSHKSKLTNKEVLNILSRIDLKEKLKDIALDYNVDASVISKIKTSARWRHIEYDRENIHKNGFISEQDKESILELLSQGKSYCYISRQLSICRKKIAKLINR